MASCLKEFIGRPFCFSVSHVNLKTTEGLTGFEKNKNIFKKVTLWN